MDAEYLWGMGGSFGRCALPPRRRSRGNDQTTSPSPHTPSPATAPAALAAAHSAIRYRICGTAHCFAGAPGMAHGPRAGRIGTGGDPARLASHLCDDAAPAWSIRLRRGRRVGHERGRHSENLWSSCGRSSPTRCSRVLPSLSAHETPKKRPPPQGFQISLGQRDLEATSGG